jgi:heme-degrading monooxygenase HmoA
MARMTVFRSRLRPEAGAAYEEMSARMLKMARSMPGFVEAKTFSAGDDERLTLVIFEDRATQEAWRDHPEHRAAQELGRTTFYDAFDLLVGEIEHRSSFSSRQQG